MKSSNPSLAPVRRALIAAAVVFATGSATAFAQSSSSSPGSSSAASGSDSSSYSTSGSGANGSMNNDASMGSNASDTSSNRYSNSSDSSNSSSSSDKLSWSDRHFVTKAAEGGQSEVQVGQLAQQKASNPDVRAFAQRLIQDHTQANSQLMQLAQQKNVKLDQDDGKDRTYKRLAKASGQDFDREFISHAVEDHEKDVKMYEKESQNAKDPDVRAFAAQVLPKLREHLQIAQQLQQSIVPTGRSGSDSWRGSSGSSSSSSSTDNTSSTGSASGSSSTGMSSDTSSTGASGSSSSTSSLR